MVGQYPFKKFKKVTSAVKSPILLALMVKITQNYKDFETLRLCNCQTSASPSTYTLVIHRSYKSTTRPIPVRLPRGRRLGARAPRAWRLGAVGGEQQPEQPSGQNGIFREHQLKTVFPFLKKEGCGHMWSPVFLRSALIPDQAPTPSYHIPSPTWPDRPPSGVVRSQVSGALRRVPRTSYKARYYRRSLLRWSGTRHDWSGTGALRASEVEMESLQLVENPLEQLEGYGRWQAGKIDMWNHSCFCYMFRFCKGFEASATSGWWCFFRVLQGTSCGQAGPEGRRAPA